MKPLKLEMTAFASYADKQIIDFTKLKDGIFLITGETGAGKTAIFDAIMFALFGSSSGEREPRVLKSDFADDNAKAEVKLEFLHNGKIYKVERSFNLNENGKPKKQEAHLYEGDNLTQVTPTNVTTRVAEIIGLDDKQFKNVIMLAQGEFKKFLVSKTEDKEKLLSKIFDSSSYKNFMETLDTAKNLLDKEREKLKTAIKNEIDYNLQQSSDTQLFFDDADLLEKIDEIIANDELNHKQLLENAQEEQSKYDKLLGAKQNAEALNRDIEAFDEARDEYDELLKEKIDFDEKKGELERAERFLRNVNPKYLDFTNAKKAVENACAELEDNNLKIQKARGEFEIAEENSKEIPRQRDEIEALAVKIETARADLNKYEEFDKANKELAEANSKLSDMEAQIGSYEKGIKDKKSQLAETDARLEELKDADIALRDAQDERNKCSEAFDTLNSAAQASAAIFLGEKEIKNAKIKIEDAQKDHLQKSQYYNDINTRFLNEKYEIIADEIRAKLEEEDSALCPVCGSVITAEKADRLAVKPQDTPTQKEVETAERQKDEAYELLKKAEQDLRDKQKDYEHQKQDVLKIVSRYIPEFTDWGKLTQPGKFKEKLAEFKRAEELSSQKLIKANIDKDEKKDLEKVKINLTREIEELEKERLASQNSLTEISGRAIGLKTKAEGLKSALKFESSQIAKDDIAKNEAQKENLAKMIAGLTSALNDAQKNLSEAQGKAKTLENNHLDAESKAQDAEKILGETLTKYGYLSIEHALSDLNPIGDEEPEQWIKETRKIIAEYENKLLSVKNVKDERFKKVADKDGNVPQKEDLEALNAALEEQGNVSQEAQKAAHTAENLKKRHNEAYNNIKSATNELGESQDVYERIERLANVANGKYGVKYTFERFALSSIFKEILDAANIRLNGMSGGQYEFEPEIGSNKGKGSQIGFEMEVKDIKTGKQRDTKSLSGGETFQAALALALGLSDIITNKSGGHKIDAMFIDEGFGTLSDHAIDTALNVLSNIAQADCQIGIISHVDKLRESIPQKIRVKSGVRGSVAEIE